VVLTLGADFQVLVQFLVKDHRAAFWALGPKALGDLAFLRFRSQLGFLDKTGVIGRRRSNCRLDRGRLELQCFFGKRRSHD